MNTLKRIFSIVALLTAVTVFADIKPAGIFANDAVLQQNSPIRIWGTANSSENVEVEFADQRVSTKADANGAWMVTLQPLPASATPRKMVFSSQGEKQVTLSNVVVGEVWLAGGQSNMASTMQTYRKTTQPDIDSANDPLLRMVTIPRLEYPGQNDNQPEWKTTTPQNVRGFSATAYYFAKNLRAKLNIPVGIVSCSVGATPAEAWMSRQTFSSTPSIKPVLDAYDAYMRKNFPDVEEYYRVAKEQDREMQAYLQKKRKGEKLPTRQPRVSMGPYNYKRPCGLHETMLTQTIPYTLRGVIWYQGENNSGAFAGLHYREVFSTLIKEWREEFMNPSMPFLFVQLAPFGGFGDKAEKTGALINAAELRDAQQWTEDNVDNTGMVVLVDGGEFQNIHPHSKDKAGLRLSLLARNMVYGEKNLLCRGPRIELATPQQDQIELVFKNIGSGLELKDEKVSAFEICGKDGEFVPAQAKLVDGKIIVSAESVKKPLYVRYGWRNWFVPTLFNKDGLPAAPFRTDDFEMESKGRFYLDGLLGKGDQDDQQ